MSDLTSPEYYRQQSCFTSPDNFSHLFEGLPDSVAELCRVVRGVYVHYRDDALPPSLHLRLVEVDTRYVSYMLDKIMYLDDRDLNKTRPIEKRFIGCCRDAALLLCSMLRYKGIPARIRIGFATYIRSGSSLYTDHVVTEYWDSDEKRWKVVDAEQGESLIKQNQVPFDVHDIPHDKFITSGRAWQIGRDNEHLWDEFGVNDNVKGRWFVAGYLIRDLAALNREEILLWDTWGLMKSFDDLSASDLELLDRLATLTQAPDLAFETMRAIYETDSRLTLPKVVMMYSPVSEWREETLHCNAL